VVVNQTFDAKILGLAIVRPGVLQRISDRVKVLREMIYVSKQVSVKL